jgi:hypothetical protein
MFLNPSFLETPRCWVGLGFSTCATGGQVLSLRGKNDLPGGIKFLLSN